MKGMHHHAPIRSERKENYSSTVTSESYEMILVRMDKCRCGAERRLEFKEDGTLHYSTGWRKHETANP